LMAKAQPAPTDEAPPPAEHSESGNPLQLTDSQALVETSEPVIDLATLSVEESISAEEGSENKPRDNEPELESQADIEQLLPDIEGDCEIALTEAVEPETILNADAESTPVTMPPLQEPAGGATPAPDDTVGVSIRNDVGIESAIDEILLPSESEAVDLAAEGPGDLESLDDTILLDAADEVQLPAAGLSDKIEETAKSEPKTGTLKIEQAVHDMAAAIEQQKSTVAEAQPTKKKDAAPAKTQALKKQKAIAKARALKKQKMIFAKAAAQNRKKEAQAKTQASKKLNAAQPGKATAETDEIADAKTAAELETPNIGNSWKANSSLKGLLEKYKGQAIGINYDNSPEIRSAQLVEANGEIFSVFVKDHNLHYSYPLKSILTVIEGPDGVDESISGLKNKFKTVIKVYPLANF
jgi:hypothetical protein